MEKIRNVFNPGSKHDDEVLYGSGQSSDPIHSGTSMTGSGSAQGHTLDDQEEGGRRNEPFSSSINTASTGTININDPLSRNVTSAQRPGLNSEVGSTTAIRDGVPGATSGSGLNGTTEDDTALASRTGASAYDTDRRLNPAGQAAGASESPVGQSNLQTDAPTGSSGLTGNTYPDRSVGSTSTTHPSATDKIREIASGRGEEGPQENLGSSLTEREFPLGGTSSATAGTGGPSSSTASHLERDATLGGAAVGGAGLAEHEHRHDIGSTTGTTGGTTGMTSGTSGPGSGIDPCGPGAEPAAPHFVPGPHVTDTANRLDPHVDGPGLGAGTAAATYEASQPHSTPTSNVGGVGSTGSSTREPTMFQETGFGPSTGHHKERDTALAGGAGATAYESDRPHGSTTGGLEHDTTDKQRKPSLISRLLHPGKNDSGNIEGTDSSSSERRRSSAVAGADRKASTASGMNLGMDPGASDVYHKSAALNTLDPRVAQETTSDAGYAAVEHPPVVNASGQKFGVADSGGMQGNRVVVPYEENVPPLYKHDGGAYTDEEKYGKKGAASRHASTAVGAETAAIEEKQRKPSIFSRLDPRKKSNTPQTNAVEGVEDTAVVDPSSGHEYRAVDAGGMQGDRVAVPYESNAAPLYKHDGGAYTDAEKLGGAAAAGAGVAGAGYEAEKYERESKAPTAGPGTGASSLTTSDDPKVTGVYTPLEANGPPSYRHNPGTVTPDSRAPGLTSPNDPKVTGVYTPLEANGPPAYRHDPGTVTPDSRAPGLTSSDDPKATGVYTPLEANGPSSYKHNPETTAAGVGAVGATGAGYEAEKHGHGSEATSAGTGEFSKKNAEKEVKQEKHREKVLAKEEKHDGKKHGGILGFLHRDKADKDLKEEQAERQESSTFGISGAEPAHEGAAGPGAIGINEHEREEHEKHERNRLHKAGFQQLQATNLSNFNQDPPASMMAGDTSYAAAPASGYASNVTGGTGTTALAQGDSVASGSHLSGLGNKLDPA
ncbi:hypothetical protein MMC27_006046 [Xylographa pallens]|nr:hypothetical protein [Xylographa pallens]